MRTVGIARLRQAVVAVFLVCGASCASVSMLPQAAADVDFNAPEGKTGWSQYRHQEDFPSYSLDQVYQAAKVGLGSAGFSLRRADKRAGVVIGEHGITLHDWNVIAGVYMKAVDAGVKVLVLIEGSKDIGFSGDVTSDGWSGKILLGMRSYLSETYFPVLRTPREGASVELD